MIKWHAMVINGGFAIPHVGTTEPKGRLMLKVHMFAAAAAAAEAEVFVDQQFVLDQRNQNRKRDRQALPSVRFRVYDTDAMTSVAEVPFVTRVCADLPVLKSCHCCCVWVGVCRRFNDTISLPRTN